jgi:ATP-dependent helicase/nuclease subunit A
MSCCATCRTTPPAERRSGGASLPAQPANGSATRDVTAWSGEALAVTEAPAHAALFAESSRAEVPLIGTVRTRRGTFTVSGQVDPPGRVRARGADRRLQDQPAAARGCGKGGAGLPPPARALPGVAGEIYPGRTVRAFLLWTAVPMLMEIDAKPSMNQCPTRLHLDSPDERS